MKVTSRTADWLISCKMLSPDEAARWKRMRSTLHVSLFSIYAADSLTYARIIPIHVAHSTNANFLQQTDFQRNISTNHPGLCCVSITEAETGTREINIAPQSRGVSKRRRACFSGVISSFRHIHSASAVLFLSFMPLLK